MTARHTCRGVLGVLMLAVGVLAAVPATAAAPPTTERCDVGITMRDGTRLSANLSLPSRPGRYPTLLTTTPYGKDAGPGAEGPPTGPPSLPGQCPEAGSADTVGAASRGYAVLSVDWRGTGKSAAGQWYTRQWLTDSEDILDWVQAQPWSNDRVGVTGCSNLGGSTIVLATADQARMRKGKPRAVYAAWADSFFPDVYRASVGQGGASITPATLAIVGLIDGSYAYRQGNVAGIQAYQPVIAKQAEINAGTSSYDQYWQAVDTTAAAGTIDIPLGMTAAISDLWQLGLMPFDYALRTTRSSHPSFFLSPGGHCTQGGWDALSYGGRKPGSKQALVMAWFDHWLKGARNGIDRLPNWNIYPTGAKGWTVQSAAMPTRGTSLVDFYLDHDGDGSVTDGGTLETTRPKTPGRDTIVCTCGPSAGADPTDTLVAPDVTSLRYDTPVFTRDTTLAGNAIAQLSIDFDRSDGTISANLVDVAPDGTVSQIADAQIRARDRAVRPAMSFVARGRLLDAYHPLTVAARQEVTGVASYAMTFNPLAHVVAKGHRVQMRLAFTDPKYLLPAPLLASMAGETMRVVHGGSNASRITLSVITGSTSVAGESYDR